MAVNRQTYTDDGKKTTTTTKPKTQKEANKQAIQNINRTGTVSGKASGVKDVSAPIPKTNTDTSNLAGNNRAQAYGTPKMSGTSKTNVLGKASSVPKTNTLYSTNYSNPNFDLKTNSLVNTARKSNSSNKKQENTYQPSTEKNPYKQTYSGEDYVGMMNNYAEAIEDGHYKALSANLDYRDMWSDEDKKYYDDYTKYLGEIGNQAKIAKGYAGRDQYLKDTDKGYAIEELATFDENGKGEWIDFSKDIKSNEDEIKKLEAQDKELDYILSNAEHAVSPDEYNNYKRQSESVKNRLDQLRTITSDLTDKQKRQDALIKSNNLDYLRENGTTDEYLQYIDYMGSYINTTLEDIGLNYGASQFRKLAGLTTFVENVQKSYGDAKAKEINETITKLYEDKEVTEEEYNEVIKYAESIVERNTNEVSTGAQLNDIANQLSEMQLNGESATKKLVVNVVGNILDNTTSQYGPALLFGRAGMMANTAVMSFAEYAPTYQQDIEQGFTPEQAMADALFQTGIEFASEMIGGERILRFAEGDILPRSFAELVLEGAKSGLAESAEEGIGWLASPLAHALTTGEMPSIESWKPEELKEAVTTAFLAGFFQAEMSADLSLFGTESPLAQTERMLSGFLKISTDEGKRRVQDFVTELDKMEPTASIRENIVLPDGRKMSERDYIGLVKNIAQNEINAYDSKITVKGVEIIEPNRPNTIQSLAEDTRYALKDCMEVARQKQIQSLNESLNAGEAIQTLNEKIAEEADKRMVAENSERMAQIQQQLNKDGIKVSATQWDQLDDNAKNNATIVSKVSDIVGGFPIEFADLRTKDGKIVDGFFDDGRIVVNPNSNLGAISTFIHEYTHGTEAGRFYSLLRQEVENLYGKDYKREVQKLMKEYSDIKKLSFEDAEKELTARTVQNLLGNKEFISRLVKYHTDMAYKMYTDLRSMTTYSTIAENMAQTFMQAFTDNETQMDADYMKAVKNGDMETAQRLVRNYAILNGYSPEQFYHATASEGFNEFDKSKIKAFETDADYNGFWVSSDPNTSPSFRMANKTYPLFIRYGNIAPADVIKRVQKELRKEWRNPDQKLHDEARSFQDEVRLRLEDLGYNSIIHDDKVDINVKELEQSGATEFTSARGTRYRLWYDEERSQLLNEPVYTLDYWSEGQGDWMWTQEEYYGTPQEVADDINTYRYGEKVVVLFEPDQLKSSAPVEYDDNGNVIPLSERFNSESNDIRYSYGYHYGAKNLDYNKKSERLSSRSGRGTGAFGTGTYFFGKEGAERAKGYHFTDGRTEHKVDFSNYNLYKPKNAEQGFRLHQLFKELDDNYSTQIKSKAEIKQRVSEIINELNEIEPNLNDDGSYEDLLLSPEQEEDIKNRLIELGDSEKFVEDMLDDNRNERGGSVLADYLADDLNQRYIDEDEWSSRRQPRSLDYAEDYENMESHIPELAEILGEDEDYMYDVVNEAIRSAEADTYKRDFWNGNYDSVGTRVMKKLGYEGIDVRDIKELDNSSYGSVIYDLKPSSVQYSYNKEEADKISKEDKDLIKRATKELSTVKDSTRKANTKAEVAQALNEVNETGDISSTTLGRLRQKVIESTLTRVPNDNYEIAKLIRQEMGWNSLPKKDWDVVFQTINDRFSIVSDDQYPSGYQDAKELIDNYLSDVGGKYIYLSPVEQGWISAEVYERTIEDAIKNATDVLKYGSTEQDIASSIINEVSDYLDGTDASLERLAEQAGYESVQNIESEDEYVPFEELTELSEYGNIEERHRREFRLLQEISQDLFRKSGRDGVWDSEERYRLLENAGVRKRVSEILRAELESRGYSDSNPNGLLEDTGDYKIYKDVDGQTFHDIFSIAQLYTPLGELVDVHPADTVEHDGWTELGYKETRNFISEDGMSGFTIEPDGNLISVFNASGKPGFLKSIAPFVRKNASKCDCYVLDPKYTGTNLPKMYNTIFGFEVDHIEEYNVEEYGDEKGIARRYENPPIAYMVNPRLTATQENQTDDDLNMTDEELEKYGGVKTVETQKYGKKNIDKETGIYRPKAIVELDSTIGKTTHEEEMRDGEDYAGRFAQELDNGTDVDDLLQRLMENPLQNGLVRAYYVSQVLADRDMQSEYMELAQWARDIDNLGGKLIESTKILYDLDSTFSRAVYLSKVEENLKDEYKQRLKGSKGANVEQIINELFNKYANDIINSKTNREFRSAIGALSREVNRKMPKTIWDRITQYRMLAMLSGSKTAISNAVSNLASVGLYRMNGINQALLESALQDVTIRTVDDTKTYKIKQEDRRATLKKDSKVSKRNRQIASEVWKTLDIGNRTKYGIETEKIPDIIKKNLKTENDTVRSKASKFVDMMFETAQSAQSVILSDAPFARMAFVQKFDELARARNINLETIDKKSKVYNRLIDDAFTYAEEVVSHNETDISKTIANITRASSSNVRINEDSTLVGLDKMIKRFKEKANNGEPIYKFIDGTVTKLQKWFIPFYKTNASIFQKSLQYSPLEWFQVANDWGKVKAGRMELVDMVDHMAKAVTGSELYLLGMAFGFLGWLKWEKDDEDYSGRLSIKIPGTDNGYTVDFIDPVSTTFAKGVVLAQEGSENGVSFKALENLVRDYEDIFLSDELDMFSSLKDFFDTVGKVRKGEDEYGEYTLGDGATDIAFNVLNSYVPAIVRDVSRMIDPAKKVVYDTDNKKYLFNRLVNSTPFRSLLVNKKDSTGRTMNYTQPFTGNDVFDRLLTQMVSRGKLVDSKGQSITTRTGSPTMQESSSDAFSQMAQDFKYNDENGDGFSDAHWIRDSVPSNIYPGGNVTELTPEEKDEYGTTWTNVWNSGANYLVDNETYKGLNYENQADVIYELQGFARECIEADYCLDHNIEMTEAQRTAYEIRNFCTVDGKVDGKMLGLIALGTAKENKLASGGQRYVMAEQDENGKTIRNSRQLAMRHIYEEAGIYDQIVEAVQNSDGALTYADFGLGKTVVEKYSDDKADSDYQDIYGKVMKGSSGSKKKTKKITGGSAGGITKAKGGGTLAKIKGPSAMASNPSRDTNIANNFFRAYANTFRRGNSEVSSASGGQVVCPRCGNRVYSRSGRCPICGASL